MAVIISNGNVNLSTAGGFYRVEADNLGAFSPTSLALTTTRYQTITFANAGNCKGLLLNLITILMTDMGVQVMLQKAVTVGSFTIAAPGKVNITAHGLIDLSRVQFTSTGTLPTGIVANTTYYVRNKTANDFEISTTPTAAVITFTGSPTGTATCWPSVEATAAVTSVDTATEIITQTGHGYENKQSVYFTSDGTLPTGITAGTIYYILNKTTDTYQLSTTPNGSVLALSGSPSGTHTAHRLTNQKVLSTTDIAGSVSSGTYAYRGQYFTPFLLDTPVAITTAASGWRFMIAHTQAGTGTWNVRTSDATNPFYAVWCDNAVSFTNSDVLIVKDYVTIDQSATLGAKLGTGETVAGVSGIICSNVANPAPDDVAWLKWANPPAAAYTLTVGGNILMQAYSGFRVGTSAARIPVAQKATITFTTPTAGTAVTSFVTPDMLAAGMYGGLVSFFLYGEIPTYQITHLASDAAVGQANLVCTDNVNWVNGDQVVMGKQNVQGQGETSIYTVSSVATNTITLTSNVLTYIRRAGATVIRLGGHGILLQNTGATVSNHYITNAANFQISGVDIIKVQFRNDIGSTYYYYLAALGSAYRSQHLMEDIAAWTTTTTTPIMGRHIVPPDGILMQRVYAHRMSLSHTSIAFYSNGFASGRLTIQNCAALCVSSGTTSLATNIRLTLNNNSFENYSNVTPFFYITGIDSIFTNNKIWGNATTEVGFGAVGVAQAINAVVSGNTYDNNLCALVFGAFTNVNCIDTDSVFGGEYANTTDIGFVAGTFPDYTFKSNGGNLVISAVNIPDMVVGGRVGFADWNNTANDDRDIYTLGRIQRTGAGLTDTIVHTAGGFAMRFETTGSENFNWSQTVPTGNIQAKTMVVAVWCKINSANYYSGTYQLPRLYVEYDSGTSVYTQAAATTDWQLLTVVITPTTTFGQITAMLDVLTDQTGSNSYVYWDDFSVLYPAGYVLNLGSLDLWANALPVTPTIATLNSALDVWAAPTSAVTVAGTVGEAIVGGFVRINTAQAGASLSVTLDAGASAIDDFYNEDYIVVINVDGSRQARRIADYNGTTKVASIGRAWSANPTSASRFIIFPFFSVEKAVWEASTAIDYGANTTGELVKTTEKKVDDATAIIVSK